MISTPAFRIFLRQHANFNPGMHALRYVTTFYSARSYCVLAMLFTKELQNWVPTATLRTPFSPTRVHITSESNCHTILLTQLVGHPVLASMKSDWQIALSKALRECHADLSGDINLVARPWWSSIIGCADSGLTPASAVIASRSSIHS